MRGGHLLVITLYCRNNLYLFLSIFFSCRIGSNVHAVIVSTISLYCYVFDTDTMLNPVK